ncbi:MAG: AraC family transcriptional regulator [Leptonema illini]|uniref:AraC family transcriptional regulator n=1 Tax=Leptonema illini TaxID=183 RepID=A0A833LY04_9LEPT|nr:MAG: AraC family transcriptional regulator [Leptonema illini]PKL34781.1 MAG: AraC family transcriptional regulator [Spirochaetae bacterium HGW-Spirochaetae-10]
MAMQELVKYGDLSCWMHPIPVDLQPFVRSWCGYEERTEAPLQRREYPGVQVVLIFEFSPPLRVYKYGSDSRFSTYSGGFVAGLHDVYSLTEHHGYQCGFQVNLSPIGAFRFFGIPMSEISGRVVSFVDLFEKNDLQYLNERLGNCPTWSDRFTLVTDVLRRRILTQRPLSAFPAYLHEIESGRRWQTREMADDLGFSQKHLISLFKRTTGVTPTQLRRIARFERLLQSLRSDRPASLADLAQSLGYYDQAHMNNEVKDITGLTPASLVPAF